MAVGIADQAVRPDGTPAKNVSGQGAEDGQPTTPPAAGRHRSDATETTAAAASFLDRPVTLAAAALAMFALTLATSALTLVFRSAITRNRRRGA